MDYSELIKKLNDFTELTGEKPVVKILNPSENALICKMIGAIEENVIIWNEEEQEYTEDCNNWIFTLSASEKNTLDGLRLKF